MIVQNISEAGTHTDMTFTVPASDVEKAKTALAAKQAEIGYDVIQSETELARYR